MARRNQFTVDAESVQGNEGAKVTFKLITVGTRDRWINDPEYGDIQIVQDHLLDWKGIEDDEGHEMPSPKDKSEINAVLYIAELQRLVTLLLSGQMEDPKN